MRKHFNDRARGLAAIAVLAIAATSGQALHAADAAKPPAAAPSLPQNPQSLGLSASDAGRDARLAWWREARFGMFIHWGLYAQDGSFWKGQDGKSEHMMRHLQIHIADYEKIANDFNPVKFNAAEWVRIAKDAGMKYMIITSKHHDGFAMYDSKSDSYNIVARTPFKRDPIKELAEACRAQGLRFGVYYSLGRDWHDPDVPTRDGYRSNTWDFPDESKKVFSRYFERKVKPQVTELLSNYGPIAVMWFDTPEKISKAESEELIALIHKLQPECIINARVGNRLGDYDVQEQKIPDQGDPKPWETCMTLNGHWGYHKMDTKWKPTETLVEHLADVVSKGGNFLLNVGPTGEGLIPAPSVERLEEVGRWLKVNGEGIYGTTAGPFKKLPWGCCTKKANAEGTVLYLHVFQWPPDGKLLVPGLKSEVQSAVVLGTPAKLATTAALEGVIVTLPKAVPNSVCPTVALRIKGAVDVL
jgi:alpha-L-fucosidase